MNEEIFISMRIRSRNQALLQNLLQVGCIINRIDHCVEQNLYVNCVPLHDVAVVQKQQSHKLTDRAAIAFPKRMNIVQLWPCSKRCELQMPQRAPFPAIFPAAIDLKAFGASL